MEKSGHQIEHTFLVAPITTITHTLHTPYYADVFDPSRHYKSKLGGLKEFTTFHSFILGQWHKVPYKHRYTMSEIQNNPHTKTHGAKLWPYVIRPENPPKNKQAPERAKARE